MWKIVQSLQMVREMGASTIVEFFPWPYFEGQRKGLFDWARADMIINHANDQGLAVIARMGMVPDWARPDPEIQPTSLNYLTSDIYEDFADFVVAFAERYEDKVFAIQIWNEPNLTFEWGYLPPDPDQYAELMRVVYPLVKATSPNILILGGALAPTLEPPGSPNGLNDLLYLDALLQHGIGQYLDALAVHTYGFSHPAYDEPASEKLNFRRVELVYDLMSSYGVSKPVYITESGWNDHPRWSNAVRPSQRIQNTLAALEIAEEWDWLETLCIWAFRYPTITHSYPDYFTLVTTGFQRKPIYESLRAYSRGEEESESLWLPPPLP